MPPKGATLSSQSQQLVLKCWLTLKNGGPIISINSVQERVAAGLKISVRTLLRIKCRNNTNPILGSPGKKRSCKKFKTTDLPECIKMNIRDTVYTMYANSKTSLKGNATISWQDDDVRSVRKPGGYDEKRFVVVHAGSQAGFVHRASLLFASKSQNADYHGEINGDTFLRWLEERLVNNLEEPSLIVLDNAPYHSMLLEKVPTSSWKKADRIQWLITNNIEYNSQIFKTELLALVKVHRKEKSYKVDVFLRSRGHDVLRLPPYHCQFNAIEMVGAVAKGYYNKHMGRDGYGIPNVFAMWDEALQQCTMEFWQKCIRHTEKVITDWYEREKALDITVNDKAIHVDGGDETSTSETE